MSNNNNKKVLCFSFYTVNIWFDRYEFTTYATKEISETDGSKGAWTYVAGANYASATSL